jgi:hypothetical protein
MSKSTMTPEKGKAVAAALHEFHAACDAVTQAWQEEKPLADLGEAIRGMDQKRAAWRSLSEKFSAYKVDLPG